LIGAGLVNRESPRHALGSAIGAYLTLPGLRGLWTMGAVDSTGDVHDYSGQLRTLTNAAGPTLGYATTVGLGPCLTFNGTTQRLYRADEGGIAITGAMTCGLWFKPTTLAAADKYLLSKWNATGNQRSWSLYVDAANGYVEGDITTDGSTVKSVLNDNPTWTEEWIFAALRFTPSTELALFVYDQKWVNTTSIPATIYDSTAPLEIGSIGSGGTISFDGQASFAFLCAYALSDVELGYLYQISRPLFGVTNAT
jgi:hypothetical protein